MNKGQWLAHLGAKVALYAENAKLNAIEGSLIVTIARFLVGNVMGTRKSGSLFRKRVEYVNDTRKSTIFSRTIRTT
jgi:hypothetical protein